MPDRRFFSRSEPKALADLAALTGSTVPAGMDPQFMVEDVSPLDHAGPRDLSFLDNVRYKDQFRVSKAGVCVVNPDMAQEAPSGMLLLLNREPYKAYARIAQAFYPQRMPAPFVSKSAYIATGVKIGGGCVIEDGAVIGRGAEIGEGSWIGANVVIGENVVVGSHCQIGANAVISYSLIGDHVCIYPGCCIGQDGFGFAIDSAGHVKVPQLGRVLIEDHVQIGANTTIDRGSGPDTVIGQGTWIDNLVQIGHNVKIGKGCVIAGQVGISGSTILEDYVVMAGQVGIAGHLRIGKGARIAGKSGVLRDVPAGEEQMGYPALPLRAFMRQIATLNRMIKKDKS